MNLFCLFLLLWITGPFFGNSTKWICRNLEFFALVLLIEFLSFIERVFEFYQVSFDVFAWILGGFYLIFEFFLELCFTYFLKLSEQGQLWCPLLELLSFFYLKYWVPFYLELPFEFIFVFIDFFSRCPN